MFTMTPLQFHVEVQYELPLYNYKSCKCSRFVVTLTFALMTKNPFAPFFNDQPSLYLIRNILLKNYLQYQVTTKVIAIKQKERRS